MNFKLLETTDYETLKPYFRNQSYNLCIYTLPSLIVWTNSLARHFFKERDGRLIMTIDYPKGQLSPHLIMPISPEKEVSPEELFDISKSVDLKVVSNVPESYLTLFGQEKLASLFQIDEQPEYEDYVYRTEDLSFLKGKKYSKKRNLIHQFEKEYVSENRVVVAPMSSAVSNECLIFLEKWCEEKDCGEDRDKVLACEREAAIRAILHIESIGMKGIILRIDGEINAIGMASVLNRETSVLHFEKAFNRVKGLYQYFDRECSRQLFSDHPFINKENDMNIPGIAHAKSSYFPAMRIKSFKLTRR